MRTIVAFAVGLAVCATTSVSATAQRVAPPIHTASAVSATSGQQVVLRWRADRIACSEGELPAAAVETSDPQLIWPGLQTATAQFRFSTDTAGHPLDIERSNTSLYVPLGDDLAPALAASRFPAGAEHHDCRISFVPAVAPIASASVSDLLEIARQGQTQWRAVVDRIEPVGSDCVKSAPAPLLRGFPDFTKVKRHPGRINWSMVTFDIDKSGKPVAIKTAGGGGDSAFDFASRRAVAVSRFSGGKRSGCFYPYWQSAGHVAAPPIPEKAKVLPSGSTCPVDVPWSKQPTMAYPPNYRRRAVEGWAVIGFDTAPWGATGNLHVIAAEPSADFGQAAIAMLQNGSLPKSDRSYVGCVERVRFVMKDDTKDSAPD